MWFSLRRTTKVGAGESGEAGNPGTLGMTKERAALYGEWLLDRGKKSLGSGLNFRTTKIPFPLSSRAKPRDLQFYGSFLDMFLDGAQGSAVSLQNLTSLYN
jgi:hypothetical protein